MIRELGVITDLQTAEIAISEKNLTLLFDGTTQEGVHASCIHLTTKTGCQVVALDELSGGTSEDFEQHICQSVDNLAKTYVSFHLTDFQECRQTIIGNISNTISDRAVTNHATIKKLNLAWNKTFNELNCHLHPLETFSSSCRSALKVIETEKGKLFGSDCMAGNIAVQLNNFGTWMEKAILKDLFYFY